MIDYITFLVTNIVSKPESVSVVEQVEDDSSYTYVITVDKDDMGMLIGREGRTIKSLRTLAKLKAIRDGTRVNVTLSEPIEDKASENE
jgi:predicted RNA-binding protein YlqC (UPF0109 family)